MNKPPKWAILYRDTTIATWEHGKLYCILRECPESEFRWRVEGWSKDQHSGFCNPFRTLEEAERYASTRGYQPVGQLALGI